MLQGAADAAAASIATGPIVTRVKTLSTLFIGARCGHRTANGTQENCMNCSPESCGEDYPKYQVCVVRCSIVVLLQFVWFFKLVIALAVILVSI